MDHRIKLYIEKTGILLAVYLLLKYLLPLVFPFSCLADSFIAGICFPALSQKTAALYRFRRCHVFLFHSRHTQAHRMASAGAM